MEHIKNLKKIMLVAFIFTGCTVFGQEENTNDGSLPLAAQLGPENLGLVLSKIQAQRATASTKAIYIQQVGSDNTVSANVRAQENSVQLFQIGNDNRTQIDVSGNQVTHNLLQSGDNNLLLEYGNAPQLDLERHIVQNGNDQGVVIFGSNSLTDNLILNLQGNSKSITIRNFN